jgi:gluconate 5-dehydrogenase
MSANFINMKSEKLSSVQDKIALVTGSTGGLGSLFARGLAENGCRVILNSRSPEKLDRQVQEFSGKGLRAYGYAFDVTDTDQISRAIVMIGREVGPPDILVNHPGAMVRAPLEEFRDEDWEKVIGTHLTGTFKVSRAVVPGMIEKGAGKIINIGSMQSELGRFGIGPGSFRTNMTRAPHEDPEMDAWLRSRTPAGRWGKEVELLGALLFLASDASRYMNGHMIYVDGGLLATV